ncbi:MAG: hypothetical protein WCL54_00905 [Clostridia bacterium]
MKLVVRSILAIFRRPVIILFLGAIIGLFTVFSSNFIKPISDFLATAGQIGTDGTALTLLDSFYTYVLGMVNLMEYLQDPKILLMTIGGMLLFSIVLGAILALGFSGYFNAVYYAMDKKKSNKHSFIEGIKKYFLRMWKINFIFLLLTICTFVVASVAAVPAVTFLKTDGFHEWGILLTIVTILVLFFTTLYYVIYVSFWYPAVYAVEAKPFQYSKKLVDGNFLGILLRIIFIGIFFCLCNFLFSQLVNSLKEPFDIGGVVLQWIFNTLFFAFATTYVFALFRFLDKRNQNKRVPEASQK